MTIFGKKKADPRKDPMSIGCLAIAKGYATYEQVEAAVKKQEERHPLGEILVEQGVLTIFQLDELLIEQEIARQNLSPKVAAKIWHDYKIKQMRETTKIALDFSGVMRAAHKHGT
jgi:hypothetical protein